MSGVGANLRSMWSRENRDKSVSRRAGEARWLSVGDRQDEKTVTEKDKVEFVNNPECSTGPLIWSWSGLELQDQVRFKQQEI